VKQQNLDRLHDILMRVSDPRSSEYGHHLSNDEVHALTAPKVGDVSAVMEFLLEYGVVGRRATPNSDMITAKVPINLAERMLSAKYVQLTHTSGLKVHRAPGGYSLPEKVASAVDFVGPVVHVPGVSSPSKPLSADRLNVTSQENVPLTLRQLYNVGDTIGQAADNKFAVTAFLKQYYDESALKDYWSTYCTGITCGKGLPALVGDATTGSAGEESMLDIEAITGVAGNIASEFWGFSGSSSDNTDNEPFLKWLQQVDSTPDADVPKLFSTSYGEAESSWSEAAAARVNSEFMKVGARGITLLYASGDSGANCNFFGKFAPNFPATSPYVTAVGGTQPDTGFPNPGSESAIGLSSGGFSNYWATPSWQQEAVDSYLQQDIPSTSHGYNTSGRAFPDISAQATNFCVTPFGCNVAGTSCASPTAAGVFGLLNDLRINSGKAPLGFLNPLLYQNQGAFNDITTGTSKCSFFGSGWPATAGWDAVTGLGTPDYVKLAQVVQGLQGPPPVWHQKEVTV